MVSLSIDSINGKAPYRVLCREDRPFNFYFRTDFSIDFNISIKPDYSIILSGAYTLDITNAVCKSSPNDPKFRKTLIAIIEEFFDKNNDVMLYVTETGDDKQMSRNRLFVRWFNTYEGNEKFFIHTAEGKMEGQLNFMALFSRKDNPNLPHAVEEFDETVSFLFDHPVIGGDTYIL